MVRVCAAVGVRGSFLLAVSVAGWSVCFLVGKLEVTERVWCCFGSCGWGALAHSLGTRLEPPIFGAWRFLALVTIGVLKSLLAWGLGPESWSSLRLLGALGRNLGVVFAFGFRLMMGISVPRALCMAAGCGGSANRGNIAEIIFW